MKSSQGFGQTRHLATLRRLYLYIVALVCLVALQGLFQGLAREVVSFWSLRGIQYFLTDFADIDRKLLERSSYLLVTSLCLTVHNSLILGWVRRDPLELDSSLRKLFLFASAGSALGFCVPLIGGLLHPALSTLFGFSSLSSGFWPPHYIALGIPLILSGAIFIRYRNLLYLENGNGKANLRNQALEAVFFALLYLIAILILLSAALEALNQILVPFVLEGAFIDRTSWDPSGVLVPLTTALTVVFMWRQITIWRISHRQGRPHEWGNVFHIVVLQTGQLIGLIFILVGMVQILQPLLGILDGREFQGHSLWADLGPTLFATLPLGLAYWLGFRRKLSRAPEGADLGRWSTVPYQLYLYSVIALSLYWTVAGSHEFIISLFGFGNSWNLQPELLTPLSSTGGNFSGLEWVDLAPLLIGIPTLFFCQRQLSQLNRARSFPAIRDLHWLPRRLYLYGITVISTLSILWVGGQVLQTILKRTLGLDDLENYLPEVFAHETSLLGVLTVVLAVHVYLLSQSKPSGPNEPKEMEAITASLHEELASAQEQRKKVTKHIRVLEKQIAQITKAESEDKQDA